MKRGTWRFATTIPTGLAAAPVLGAGVAHFAHESACPRAAASPLAARHRFATGNTTTTTAGAAAAVLAKGLHLREAAARGCVAYA